MRNVVLDPGELARKLTFILLPSFLLVCSSHCYFCGLPREFGVILIFLAFLRLVGVVSFFSEFGVITFPASCWSVAAVSFPCNFEFAVFFFLSSFLVSSDSYFFYLMTKGLKQATLAS